MKSYSCYYAQHLQISMATKLGHQLTTNTSHHKAFKARNGNQGCLPINFSVAIVYSNTIYYQTLQITMATKRAPINTYTKNPLDPDTEKRSYIRGHQRSWGFHAAASYTTYIHNREKQTPQKAQDTIKEIPPLKFTALTPNSQRTQL